MSVAGFDVGNDTSVVALARRKGIDVVLNSESSRLTPSMVAFTAKQRFRGCVAGNNLATNPTNTVNCLKRLLGKKFSDPVFQNELAIPMFKCAAGPDDEPLVTVQYLGEERQFTPTQLMGMLMGELKTIAENDQGSKITDCVFCIPVYFTDAERRAMLDASSIAGLNCLRLMHENTATALAYGIYKTDLPENDPVNVAFVDVGESSFQVNIVAFKKGQLKVLSHGFDRCLGGRDLDLAMMKFFAAEFEAKHKVNVLEKPRSRLRLRVAVEKLKKILTANSEGVLSVECLHEEIDFQSKMTRDQLEELAIATLSRVKEPLTSCLAESGLSVTDISSVELVGSASRIPAVVKIVQDFFGQDIKRTLNVTESAARGAALQGAMLSPAFKVRDFEVQDCFPFAYAFTWPTADDAGKPTHVNTTEVLFPKGSTYLPSTKALTLSRSAQFDLKASVVDGDAISSFTVGPIPPNKEAEGVPKLKVMFKLDLHGIVKVDSVQAVEEVVVPAEPAPPAELTPPPAPAEGEGEEPKEGDKMEEDKPAEEPPKIKTKKIKTDVQVTTKAPGALPPAKLRELVEKEFEMCLQDRVMEETKEKKNALEEYIYSMRNKLCEQLAEYITEQDKEALNALLEKTEDWLYDEGEDETKGVYIAKLDELTKVGGPVAERFQEAQTRDSAAQTLDTVCGVFMAQCADAKFEHIDEEERAKVVKECTEAKAWLADKMAQQAALPKTSPPAVLTKELEKRKETIERFCKPIMSKPKPKPAPKPEEEKAPEEEAKPAEGEAMETEETPVAQEAPEPMQADLD